MVMDDDGHNDHEIIERLAAARKQRLAQAGIHADQLDEALYLVAEMNDETRAEFDRLYRIHKRVRDALAER